MNSTPFSGAAPPRPGDARAAERGLAEWRAAADGTAPLSAAGRALLEALFGNSPFLGRCALDHPETLRMVLERGPEAALADILAALAAGMGAAGGDRRAAGRPLRLARGRAALVCAAADIAGIWSEKETAAALSRFADAAIGHAAACLLREAHDRRELALPDPGAPQDGSGLIVLGLGKLGGGELNFSSDVDLIVLYDADAAPLIGRARAQDVFIRLAQRLGQLLEARTGDGYVFRCDFRLRPDPAATPAAVSTDAAETYYASLGQNWERGAMIKARPVAGDAAAAAAFLRAIRSFVWRRHLDFAAIRDIQSIRRQIRRHRGGGEIAVAGHNVKLGRGGIRDIEYFVQTQQLIWGGRDPALRARGTEDALRALAGAGRIGHEVADALIESYWSLRRVEHRLQMVADRQTHSLPGDGAEMARIAAFLGHDGPEALARELRGVLERVAKHCEGLFADAEPLDAGLPGGGNLSFTGADPDPETLVTLKRMGFREPPTVSGIVSGWHRGRFAATRGARARELLTELVPALLRALAGAPSPDQALARFDTFLRGLPAGVQLFSLFTARPQLLGLVAEIVGAAPRIANYLSARPAAIDAVLTHGFFDELPDREACRRALAAELALADDMQGRLEAARKWAADAKFRVSVQQLLGTVGAAEAGPALSDIADVLLEAMLGAAAEEFAVRHGRIAGGGLAVMGFGKLGGRLLSRGSDLDLVFVYETPNAAAASDGRRALSASAFYARLGQRLITALSARTGEGLLFEIDMRLRPMGEDGPLASEIGAWERYYRGNAWTWELMALSRARVAVAPPALKARIEALIREALTRPRDPRALAREVAGMRRRIAAEHGSNDPLAVKHVAGGLVDAEFIAQYLTLRDAARHPELVDGGAHGVYDRLGTAGALSSEDAAALTAAADLYYNVQAMQRLSLNAPLNADDAPEGLRRALARAGGVGEFAELTGKLRETQARVHSLFESIVGAAAAANGGSES